MKTRILVSFLRKKMGMIGIILAFVITILFVSCIKDPSIVMIPTIPAVSTADVTNITENSATVAGSVSSEGGAVVVERGFCWSTALNPTISDDKINNGVGAGPFTATINGLTIGSNYHVRAYAKNSAGVSYGVDVPFATNNFSQEVLSMLLEKPWVLVLLQRRLHNGGITWDNYISPNITVEKYDFQPNGMVRIYWNDKEVYPQHYKLYGDSLDIGTGNEGNKHKIISISRDDLTIRTVSKFYHKNELGVLVPDPSQDMDVQKQFKH